MIEEVADISQSTASEAESASAAAEQQAASASEVSSNVSALSERAERLQSLLADFEVGGGGEKNAPDAAPGAAPVRQDGGRPE